MHHLLEKPGVKQIWMIEEGVPGVLLQENAFFSKVRFSAGGIEYNIDVENDEFISIGQIGYEND